VTNKISSVLLQQCRQNDAEDGQTSDDEFAIAQIPLGSSHHVTSRHAFRHREKSWRDETCRACRTARRDTLITTSATDTTRTTSAKGRRLSVDWGWHVHPSV